MNLTGPTPVTNAEFTETLGRIVRRPTVLAVPRFALSLAMGEFGRVSVLGGQNALPQRLTASGFRFTHTDLAAALLSALGRE